MIFLISFWSAEHEMHAALVVQVDVPGGRAGLAGSDGGVEVEPLPAPPRSRHQGQHVDVDVVEAGGVPDFGFLTIRNDIKVN